VQLAFLYGPPGTGKLAVGTELARLTGFKLLHNHLSVNLVSAVFERDSAEWMAMLRRVRRDVLDGAAQNYISLITTSVYRGTPENVAGFQWVLEPIRARGGSVLYVQLTCDRDELLRRVQNDDRRALDKLVDAVRLSQLMERWDYFAALPVGPHLHIDVTQLSPTDAASRIIEHYGLPSPLEQGVS